MLERDRFFLLCRIISSCFFFFAVALFPLKGKRPVYEVIAFTKIRLFSAKQTCSTGKAFDLSVRHFQKEAAQSWALFLIAGSGSLPSYAPVLTLGVNIFKTHPIIKAHAENPVTENVTAPTKRKKEVTDFFFPSCKFSCVFDPCFHLMN